MATNINILIPEDLNKVLSLIAKKTERSKSYVVRKAIERYIENLKSTEEYIKIMHDEG